MIRVVLLIAVASVVTVAGLTLLSVLLTLTVSFAVAIWKVRGERFGKRWKQGPDVRGGGAGPET